MNKKTNYIISLLFIIALIFFYTLLHEGGHALVTIICGGKVEKIVLGLNAHVQISGGCFTKFSKAVFDSAGVLLPVIFLIIALIFYNPKIKNIFYHMFYVLLSLDITASLLAWIIIPIISLFTLPPSGDDVTKFLEITGLPPVIVMVATLLIIALLNFFIYKKGLFGKMKFLYEFIVANRDKHSKVFLLRLIIGSAVGVIIAVLGFSILTPKPVFEKSFSMEVNSATEDVKLPFKIAENKLYSVDLNLKAKGILTDIQIYSKNGTLVYQNICESATIGTSLNFKKGNYVIVLTFLKDSIAMKEHFKVKGYKYETDTLKQFEDLIAKNNSVKNHQVSFLVTIK